MADQEDDELELAPADAGTLFRAEMWATNAILGYWKHLLAALLVVLLGFLFWGQYQSWVQRSQRAATAEIAEAVATLPAPLVELPERMASGLVEAEPAALEKVGDTLVEQAGATGGTARAEALLNASELYRLAENTEKQRRALADASQGAGGVLLYAAEAALANLELELGEGDAAVGRLRQLVDSQQGYLAEQAALDLGLALEHLDRKDDAVKVYDDFLAGGRSPRAPSRPAPAGPA